jgi:hypothetical protein
MQQPHTVSTDTTCINGEPLPTFSPASADAVIVWTLWKAGRPAQCIICPVGDRVELHITMTEEVVVSQQCRGQEHVDFLSNTWLEALKSRGWRENAASGPLESF